MFLGSKCLKMIVTNKLNVAERDVCWEWKDIFFLKFESFTVCTPFCQLFFLKIINNEQDIPVRLFPPNHVPEFPGQGENSCIRTTLWLVESSESKYNSELHTLIYPIKIDKTNLC